MEQNCEQVKKQVNYGRNIVHFREVNNQSWFIVVDTCSFVEEQVADVRAAPQITAVATGIQIHQTGFHRGGGASAIHRALGEISTSVIINGALVAAAILANSTTAAAQGIAKGAGSHLRKGGALHHF